MADPNVRIDDKIWRKLKRKLKNVDAVSVQVGILASDGGSEQSGDSGLTLVDLATIHEYGSPARNIPERSFIRRTFSMKEKELVEVTTKIAKKIIEADMPVEKGLNILGLWGSTEVKKMVKSGPHIPPPLKPATVAAKGSTRPLVDTGQMINAVTWRLDK